MNKILQNEFLEGAKTNQVLLSFVLMLLSFIPDANAIDPRYGALAIDQNNSTYYGWATNDKTLANAEKNAVEECKRKGGNCCVALSWSGAGCASYRAVEDQAGTVYGWGAALTKEAADSIAIIEALKRSKEKVPSFNVSKCNSSKSGAFAIIKNEKLEGKLIGLKSSAGDLYDYNGEVFNNLPHGFGTATYQKGDKYIGSYSAGKKNGKGKYYWQDGSRYEGEWKEDKKNGKGIYFYAKGGHYEGTFLEDQMSGTGSCVFANGSRYEGEWKYGKRNGKGVFNLVNGTKYFGYFKDDLMSGKGILQVPSTSNVDIPNCPKCKKYAGDFKNDNKEGFGQCFDGNGLVIYRGNFSEDKPTGEYPK